MDSGWSSTSTKSTTMRPSSTLSSTRSLPSGPTSASSTIHSGSSLGVLCDCGLPALKKTNNSGVNSVGRAFYTCSRDSCGFWKWAEDGDLNSGLGPAAAAPRKRTYTQVRIFTANLNVDKLIICPCRRRAIQ
jgi:DNA topoisomerase-3